MPIKVSDFLQHVNSYPVLKVTDNSILGYAYSTGFNQTALLEVPSNNRNTGLVLANRVLYSYELSQFDNTAWGTLTNYKEIAVKFSSYDPYPLTYNNITYDTIGEALFNTADNDAFFAVHRVSDSKYYKLSTNNVIEWLLAAMIQSEVAAGGSITTYTGNTGILGDLNNDGQVTTADLLMFLAVFGTIGVNGTYLPVTAYATNTPAIQLLTAAGTSTYTANTKVYFTLTNSTSVNPGFLQVSINTQTAQHYIEFTNPTNSNISIQGFFQSIQYVIQNLSILGEWSYTPQGGTLYIGVTVERFDGINAIDTTHQIITTGAILQNNVVSANQSEYNIGNNMGTNFSNGSTISTTSTGTAVPVTKIRFKFWASFTTSNAPISSLYISSLVLKVIP
jgi:hypothetical protein